MGKFDGILLCSDWDGTLVYNGTINERDIEKIKYFQENGGLFTFSSGRTLPYITKFFDRIHPNTYAITLNGAMIKHPDTKHILHEGLYPGSEVSEILDILFSNNKYFYTMHIYFEGDESSTELSCEDYAKQKEEIEKRRIYKLLLISHSQDKVAEAKSAILGKAFDNYLFVRSWDVSLEILVKENGKGFAVKRLKKHLNARMAVAVGDFENDIQMLKMADIGYAVGNATDEVKSAADRITVPAYEGAISKIIEDIEKEFAI